MVESLSLCVFHSCITESWGPYWGIRDIYLENENIYLEIEEHDKVYFICVHVSIISARSCPNTTNMVT